MSMSAPQPPNPHAARILDAVDKDRMLALAGKLISIPSFKGQETDAARFLADFFQERGYEVLLQEVESGRFQTIAVLKGMGGGKSLMLNGHIDINPIANQWQRDPWTPTIEGDRLYGAGIPQHEERRCFNDRSRRSSAALGCAVGGRTW